MIQRKWKIDIQLMYILYFIFLYTVQYTWERCRISTLIQLGHHAAHFLWRHAGATGLFLVGILNDERVHINPVPHSLSLSLRSALP